MCEFSFSEALDYLQQNGKSGRDVYNLGVIAAMTKLSEGLLCDIAEGDAELTDDIVRKVLQHKYRDIDVRIRTALQDAANKGMLKAVASVCGLEHGVVVEILNSAGPISDMNRQFILPALDI